MISSQGTGETPKNGEGETTRVGGRWCLRLTILVVVGGLTVANNVRREAGRALLFAAEGRYREQLDAGAW